MLRIEQRLTDDTFFMQANGLIDEKDIATILPEIESAIESHGKINLVYDVLLSDGLSQQAQYTDIALSIKHFSHINRIAILDHESRDEGLPFVHALTPTQIRKFPRDAMKEACRWASGEPLLLAKQAYDAEAIRIAS